MKGFFKGISIFQVFVLMTISAATMSAQSSEKAGYDGKGYYATPWMAGVKTNLLADMISIPYMGVETQLSKELSLDLSGWYSKWNLLYPQGKTNMYGLSPELRWWLGEQVMNKGHFLGLYGMAAWYTLNMEDKEGRKVVYQNGTADLDDPGSFSPSWSCGVTYGYSVPLDKKGHLAFEFYASLGYYRYQHKSIKYLTDGRIDYKHISNDGIGLTKVGASLAYRFSVRRYKEK